MSIDWNAHLFDPIYSTLGIEATLDLGSDSLTVTIIDQTAGIEVDAGGLTGNSIKPVALIRTTELDTAGVLMSALVDATLTFGGNVWVVKNTAPRPGPNGKGTGEIQLILMNGDL